MANPLYLQPRFEVSARHFEAACSWSRRHSSLAQAALEKYGDHGPLISGCVRSHFPDDVKQQLRDAAQQVTSHSDLAWACKPNRVHTATMRRLAREIATRDGSGFYGPQPSRA